MKNIIIFGLGEMGKKLTDECLAYGGGIAVKAVVDNRVAAHDYKGIPVIRPKDLSRYAYDEIWICTVYFEEVRNQLSREYGVPMGRMRFAEPVAPILEARLRKKYGAEMESLEPATGELAEVLSYLKRNPLRMYCYPFYDEYLDRKAQIYMDGANGLYYGMYQGKRMYLARRFDTPQKARAYFNAVTMEQDLRSPHCYLNDRKMRHLSGAGIDVGAAEGIFALGIIGQAEHVCLIEPDPQWTEALGHTFRPYQDKVTIIQKCAGNRDSGGCAKLDTLFYPDKIDFIKMDIEGAELEALHGAEQILLANRVCLGVCVYHHAEDNALIAGWLRERGYRPRNSDGLVVCLGDWELEGEPDFRKALLYADRDGEGRI